jgi:hypothetical protein
MSSVRSNSRNGVLCVQLLGYATVLKKNRTVFSVWSVPRLYNEIPRITEGVIVQGTYEPVESCRSKFRKFLDSEVPELLKTK